MFEEQLQIVENSSSRYVECEEELESLYELIKYVYYAIADKVVKDTIEWTMAKCGEGSFLRDIENGFTESYSSMKSRMLQKKSAIQELLLKP
jgi:hypothetical protein